MINSEFMGVDPEQVAIPTNGISLHVARAGPSDGTPVILLHGFPEPWFCWRKQIGPLAEAGCRVLAPDQRGYNTSDKPEEWPRTPWTCLRPTSWA